MSRDNPTQYHARTIDFFLKSYFQGLPALNEAADVMFSANNLENHNYSVPLFIHDIENYLAKAKIATVEDGGLKRREQANIINTGSQPVSEGMKHPQEAILMFDFDDWHDCAPDGDNPNPERRRELCQRWWTWQMPTKPREGSAFDAEPHPVRDMNWFHSQSHFPSSNSSPVLAQMVNGIFYTTTDGQPTRVLMDKAMGDMGVNPRLALAKNMGQWSNSDNESSYNKQFNDAWDKHYDKHNAKYGDLTISQDRIKKFMKRKEKEGEPVSEDNALVILQNTDMQKYFFQHKLWELRGVPDDYIWENLYDEGGAISHEKSMQLKEKSESRESAKYRAGFFPLYFGIPLIDYEDGLKFSEWFLDGAGHIEGEDYTKPNPRFNDKVINDILGHNARGFLTRHNAVFAQALHSMYSGNVSTSGHNSLPGGIVGRTVGQEQMGQNKQFKQQLMMSGKKHRNMVNEDVIKVIDEAKITRDEQNEVLSRLYSSSGDGRTLLDVIGDGDDTPDYHALLSDKDVKKVMAQLAQVYGQKGATGDNQEFLHNIKYLHKLKDYFFDPMKGLPEMERTLLYYMNSAIGGLEGAMGQEWSDWPDLICDAFPSVFVNRQEPIGDEDEDRERILPSVKNTYDAGHGKKSPMKPTKFNDSYEADPDDDMKTARIKRDLEVAMDSAELDDDEKDKLREKFDKGGVAYVEFPQGTSEDRDTASSAKTVSEKQYMLDKLPIDPETGEKMTLEEYVGGYQASVSPVSAGHSAFIVPMLSHAQLGMGNNPNHFAANFSNLWTDRLENENTPKSSILAMRDAWIEKNKLEGVSKSRSNKGEGGLRRVGDSTFSGDIRGIEGGYGTQGEEGYVEGKKKQSIHSSQVSREDAYNRMLMLHTLYLQSHYGIDNYSEKDHEEHNKKQTMPGTVFQGNHRDPLGRGGGAGMLYQNELLGEDTKGEIAVYDKEEYEQALTRYKEGDILRLPTPLKKNIEDRRELVSELEKIHQESNGSTFAELRRSDKNNLRMRMKKEPGFAGHYDKNGESKQYIIGKSPVFSYQEASREYIQLARIAHKNGRTENGVDFERLATEQKQHWMDELGEISPMTKDESRKNYLEDADEMHKQSIAASQIMKPLLQWANPELFKTHTPEHSNQAWADTKMLAQLCETWMRTLNPQQRKDWMNKAMVSCARDGFQSESVMNILREHFKSQGVSDDVGERRINSMIEDVTRPVSRQTWQGGNSAANVDLGEDKSVMNLMRKYVNDELNSNEYPPHAKSKLVNKIFDEVRKVLPNDATSEDFADTLHARYIPHHAKGEEQDDEGNDISTGGQSIMGEKSASSLVDFGQGSGRLNEETGEFKGSIYGYNSITGGHHHESELDEYTPLMSGGEGIRRTNKPDYTMYSEIHALNKVFRELLKHSKGSANGIETTPHKIAPLANAKGSEGILNLAERMGNFVNALKGDTKGVRKEIGKINTLFEKVGTGGLGVNEVQLPAIHTCPQARNKFGHVIRPSNKVSTHGLSQNRLIVHDSKTDLHQGGSSMKGTMDPFALRDYNPDLLPYDISADGNTQFPPVAMQQSGIPGENVNSNFSVFNDMAGGSELLRSDIETLDCLTDDTLIFKEDGRPVPVKSMHRIFDLSDLKLLRGFSGDWIASHMPKGEPVILQKKGKRLKAYSADMKLVELTDVMNDEIDKVHDKDFVVHAILDEEKLYFVDLLEVADEKTHNMPAKDRVRHLRAHFESSEHIKMPEPYNTKRADDEGLEEAVHLLREESSCDILLRDASTTYMRGEIRHPKWVLLSKEKKVDVIILDRKGMNYRIGVGPITHPENYGSRSVELEGEHYMDVGSAKGPRGYDKGEYISVFCTGVSKSGDEHPTYKIRSARVDRDAHPQATDSVETLSLMINDSKIPHRVRLNKGAIHIIFPSLDDEVIYKVSEEENGWMLEPQKTLWGHGEDYFIKLSEDMRPHWTPLATLLLKKDKDEPEVEPEVPAGHTKKRKHILPEEEEIIKRGIELIERGIERLAKEKITSTGIEGLGINYGGADVESPRGPTTNMTDDTNLDFDPAARDYKEKPATKHKKDTRIRTTEGEEAITDNHGNITIVEPRV